MPFRKPYILCEDKGGRGFWKNILVRCFPQVRGLNYSIQFFPGLANIESNLDLIGRNMVRRIDKQSPFIFFIVDADTYLKKNLDSTYHEIIENVESLLQEKVRSIGYMGNIRCILIKNCLESLICCDLEVIWRTKLPMVISDSPPNPITFQHDCNSTRSCPTAKLKNFTRENCLGEYNKVLHPERYASKINIDVISAENFSFREFIRILRENITYFTTIRS
ncbi:hypothetical protein LCGC14_0564480 [marine sediment metagenome]|uniref:DUF4276 family protein n=1 Tax=marine sediment metagenome TaxID=412755 RepID=A0A0F9S4J9_9ZZZZ|nr:DUF4276 family protein [archaeon]